MSGSNNALRGEAHEQWLCSRLHDHFDPLAHALLPESALGRPGGSSERHPDGRSAKTDIASETDIFSFKISAKTAKGTGALNQIDRAWLSKLFPGHARAPAVELLGRMCGSVDGKTIIPRASLSSPQDWSEAELETARFFLERQRLGIVSRALGIQDGVTHVAISFLNVDGEDVHFAIEASKFAKYLARNKPGARWCNVSPRGTALTLGDGLVIKRKGGDGGAKGANQIQISLKMHVVYRAAARGEIPGARLWREHVTQASQAIEGGDPRHWSALWNAEKSAAIARADAELPDLLEQVLTSKRTRITAMGVTNYESDKSRRSTHSKIRSAPAIFKRAWISGAISESTLYQVRKLRQRDADGSALPMADGAWISLLENALMAKSKSLNGALNQNRRKVEAESSRNRHRDVDQSANLFVESIAPPDASDKLVGHLSSIWKTFHAEPASIASAKTLLLAGYNPQRLLGFRNMGPQARRDATSRLVAFAGMVSSGLGLMEAKVKMGGPVIAREMLADSVQSRKTRGSKMLFDAEARMAREVAVNKGWARDGKSEILLRTYLRQSGPDDQRLIFESIKNGLSFQTGLSKWTTGSSADRDRMRVSMGEFCPDSPELRARALLKGEAFIARERERLSSMTALAFKLSSEMGYGQNSSGAHVKAILRAATDTAQAELIVAALRHGMPIRSLTGWGKLIEEDRRTALDLLADFLKSDDAHCKSDIRNRLDVLTDIHSGRDRAVKISKRLP